MKTLTIDDDNYLIPGDWNELTNDQLIFLVRMFENKVTTEEIKVKLLLYAMGASVRYRKATPSGAIYMISAPNRKKYALSAEELNVISEIFNYLFSKDGEQYSINPLLIRNPFRVTKCGCYTVYGPADGLVNITYKQFSDLQIWHTKLKESDDAVNKFISILYKSKNNEEVSLRIINKMSPTVKTCIIWFYLGCLAFLQHKFPKVFGGSGGTDRDVVDGQMRITDALAQGKLADKGKVKDSLLYDALYTMEIAAEELAKIEQQNRK